MNKIKYQTDFYAWTQQQAQFLKHQQLEQIDWEQLAEEIEDMGRSEKRELGSRLEVLILHLLKWHYQPNLRSRSWQLTIKEQRLRLEELFVDNPSLKPSLEGEIAKTYSLAVIGAEKETGLSTFPETCPYDWQEILCPAFLPEN